MADLVNKYKVAPPDAANLWTIDTTERFLGGKIALAPNWTYMWGASTAADSAVKDTVAVAPLPCGTECALSLGGWTLSAFANTDKADDAYKFIHFMTDTDRQVTMALKGGNAPTRLSAAENAEVSGIPVYKAMTDALATAVPRTRYANYPAIEAALSTAISAAVAQTSSAQDALKAARQQIESSLAG
jgi:ABC-type glycerol-3-phosphate transport system substrate-binding protein